MAEATDSGTLEPMDATFDVVESYIAPKTDVTCSYELASTFVSSWSSRDWIGLYKVGWKSPKDYYTFVWAPKADDDGKASVVFLPKHLPGEDDHAYQFCYVTRDERVHGVSATFRFGAAPNPADDDEFDRLAMEENDDAFLVIRSRTDEELEAARAETSRLQSVQLQTATERDALKERLADIEAERENEIERVKEELAVSRDKEAEARREVTAAMTRIEELESSVALVQQQANQMKTNYETKDNEVDVFKGRVVELETQKKEVEASLTKVKANAEELKSANILVRDELERAREEATQLTENVTRLQQDLAEASRVSKEHADALTMALADAKGAMETLRNKIQDLEGEIKRAKTETETARQEANVAQENVIEMVGNQEAMRRDLEIARAEISALQSGYKDGGGGAAAAGAAAALRVAHKQLERETTQLRKERDSLKRDVVESRRREQTLKQNIAKLKSKGGVEELVTENRKLTEQIDDLTRRLQMGADVYKEKFMKCHELETKLKKYERRVNQVTLDEDMNEAEESLKAAKKMASDLKKENGTLQDNLLKERERLRFLEAELSALKDGEPSFVHVTPAAEEEPNSIMKQMADEIEERRGTEEKLKERVRALEEAATAAATATEREDEAQRRFSELQQRLDESDSTVAQQLHTIEELQEKIAALQGTRA
ncbi:tax1-binding protein 1 homolog [Oscarella lobularis]|uniref:tax1-binding protein 1 homolog n=1 Tax=Oscarella lobularis TaxID=121494 RepID=UPI00331385E6